jgi:hypothetical protein
MHKYFYQTILEEVTLKGSVPTYKNTKSNKRVEQF